MRIGIIGAGNVGGTLGKGWAKGGHEVMFAARDARSPQLLQLLQDLKDLGAEAKTGTSAETAAFGEVVVLATPWNTTREAIGGAGDLAGKTLLDCVNPLGPNFSLAVGHTTSGAELIAAWAHGAKVVKIFNTTGANNMADPRFGSERATMFYCGDDAGAKATAAQLAGDLGFDPIDAGPLAQARLLEPLALLWITLAYAQGHGRDIAFKLLRR